MTGKEFIKLVAHKRIPLSCIAQRLNCKLKTLKNFEQVEKIPPAYISKFIAAFKDSLSEVDKKALSQ